MRCGCVLGGVEGREITWCTLPWIDPSFQDNVAIATTRNRCHCTTEGSDTRQEDKGTFIDLGCTWAELNLWSDSFESPNSLRFTIDFPFNHAPASFTDDQEFYAGQRGKVGRVR